MNLTKTFITKNDCYKANRTIVPKGIMVHSTATPGVMADKWFDRWNKSGVEKAVHAFVDDRRVCQHLPWNHRAWHCGAAANNTHIAFEMCEPKDWKSDKTYTAECYRNAVELAAYLCRQYHLSSSDIISHKEGYQKGVASNHGDPDHWWTYYGYTMKKFRADVDALLKGTAVGPDSNLSEGCKGEAVKALQKRLNAVKSITGLTFATLAADGIFGSKTKEAVLQFQKRFGLTADGIVGEKTRSVLQISFGDADGNGKVNAADALKVLRASVGKATLSADGKKAADVNGDGKVNAADAKAILRQAVQ